MLHRLGHDRRVIQKIADALLDFCLPLARRAGDVGPGTVWIFAGELDGGIRVAAGEIAGKLRLRVGQRVNFSGARERMRFQLQVFGALETGRWDLAAGFCRPA